MAWLQENWIIAVVGLVVAVVLLWWLFGRKAQEDIETPAAPPAAPKKPLEVVKPEIIAAEPARFKPKEPAPAPVAAAPPPPASSPPAAEPVAEAAPAPEPEPAAAIPEEPTVPAEPVAEAPPPAAPEPQPEPTPEPAPEPAAIVPEEPTVPPPAPKPVPEAVAAPEPEPAPEPAPAPAAKADNLQLLKGVGPKMAVLLSGLGITSFRQIADWTDADVAVIDPQLGAFQGRIARDAIVDQASYLACGDKAGFEAKYGALGGEL